MKHLSEKVVQDKSIEFLRRHYQETFKPLRLYCNNEVTTVLGKRADGLLCLNSSKQDLHLISLEAKSHKTLKSILPYWNESKVSGQAAIFSLLLVVLSIYFSYNLQWYWVLVIAISTGIAGFLAYYFYSQMLQPTDHKISEVISQINQYPANEKWLAVSEDSLHLADGKFIIFKKGTNGQTLVDICKKKGVGLIVVTNRKVWIDVQPKFISGNFLKHYNRSQEIIEKVNAYNR